jgi:hypothetical protein
MFSLLTYGFGTTLIAAFFYLDGHHIVKNSAVVKWKKFRKINRLVSTNYKGFFTIIWISLYMVAQALWISFIQYANSTVVPVKGGKYKVIYVIKGKTYKMIVKPTRGPRKVMLVHDGNQEDVSYLIFPYLGPEENFHGEIYTPRFFEMDELVFELSDGTEKVFHKDDDIVLI